jgi:hypothetical protein
MGIINGKGRGSRPEWTALEKWARHQVQEFVQELLKAEVTELLGRESRSGWRQWTGRPATATATGNHVD